MACRWLGCSQHRQEPAGVLPQQLVRVGLMGGRWGAHAAVGAAAATAMGWGCACASQAGHTSRVGYLLPSTPALVVALCDCRVAAMHTPEVQASVPLQPAHAWLGLKMAGQVPDLLCWQRLCHTAGVGVLWMALLLFIIPDTAGVAGGHPPDGFNSRSTFIALACTTEEARSKRWDVNACYRGCDTQEPCGGSVARTATSRQWVGGAQQGLACMQGSKAWLALLGTD